MKKVLLILIAVLAIVIYSCQKEDNQSSDGMSANTLKSAEIAASDDMLELVMSEVQYESDFYSGIENLLWTNHKMGIMWGWCNMFRYQTGKCPGVNVSTKNNGYPRTITLDYGTNTSLDHGRVLKGTITIEISGPLQVTGSTRTVTYKDFVVDTVKVNGTSIVKLTGDTKSTSISTYTDDLTFNFSTTKEVKWKGQKVREWKAGLNTPMDMRDDIIYITGYVNATTKAGDTYKKEIKEPLIRKGGCWYIVQGKFVLTVKGTIYSTLDYGKGECDAKATLTKGTETVEIDLSKHTFFKK
jgi:hypothetical protein